MTKEQIITIFVVLYVIIHSVFIEPNMVQVTKYEIEDSTLADVKVVFFSDLHIKKNEFNRLNKVVKLINEQKPDLVISGGDYAPTKNYDEMMDANVMAQKISLINAPVFSVLGEYDWYADGADIAKNLQKNGIRVLENSSMKVSVKKKYISIAGYADATARTVKAAQTARKTSKPRILVTHNPDVYYNVMEDYNLILAGHTHGGKIVIPFTPPLFTPSKYKFNNGIIKSGQNTMIVTKGLGTTGFRVRFNCKPEIVVINFVKNSSKNKK